MSRESLDVMIGDDVVASYSFDILASLPNFAKVGDVGEVAAGRAGGAVYLSALIEDEDRAKFKRLELESDDGYKDSVPLDEVLERGLVVFEDRGRPLSGEQGGPFRFLIPNAAECKTADLDKCANVKHLRVLRLVP